MACSIPFVRKGCIAKMNTLCLKLLLMLLCLNLFLLISEMFKAGGIFCHVLNMLQVQKNVSVTKH